MPAKPVLSSSVDAINKEFKSPRFESQQFSSVDAINNTFKSPRFESQQEGESVSQSVSGLMISQLAEWSIPMDLRGRKFEYRRQ